MATKSHETTRVERTLSGCTRTKSPESILNGGNPIGLGTDPDRLSAIRTLPNMFGSVAAPKVRRFTGLRHRGGYTPRWASVQRRTI